jgi:hypothetical protein
MAFAASIRFAAHRLMLSSIVILIATFSFGKRCLDPTFLLNL